MVHAVENILTALHPYVVLTVSYSSAAMRHGSYWARKNGAVSICINETWRGDKRRWLFMEWGKGLWCRWVYDGMFVGGSRCRDYYTSLGFPREKFWLGQNVVNNNFYFQRSNEVRARANHYRQANGLPLHYFLCPARLVQVKNIEKLLKAFAKYRAAGGEWDLVLTGSGPLEKELKALACELGLADCVVFAGWKNTNEMPMFYGLASCAILPSISEAWGLVVNEAMACGLPVLVSDKCGCQPELCYRGINGYGFNPFNVDEIADVMMRISSSENDPVRMGAASRQIIQNFSPENYAISLSDCIRTLRKNKKQGLR